MKLLIYACVGLVGLVGFFFYSQLGDDRSHGGRSSQAIVNPELVQAEAPLLMLDQYRAPIEEGSGAMAEDGVAPDSLSVPKPLGQPLGRSGRMLRSLDQFHANLIEASAFVGLKGQNRQVVAELHLTARCIAIIMEAEGRISYLTDSTHGFSLRAKPGYHVFAAGEGKCEFKVGEYPAFDKMKEQLAVFTSALQTLFPPGGRTSEPEVALVLEDH